MKIYLSNRTVNYFRKSVCDLGSAQDDFEAEIFDKVSAALANRGSDNRFEVDQEVLDFILSELDWAENFYLDSTEEA